MCVHTQIENTNLTYSNFSPPAIPSPPWLGLGGVSHPRLLTDGHSSLSFLPLLDLSQNILMCYSLGPWSRAGQIPEYIISCECYTTLGQAVPSAPLCSQGHRFRRVTCLALGHTGTHEDLDPSPSMSIVPLCEHLLPLAELSREDSNSRS